MTLALRLLFDVCVVLVVLHAARRFLSVPEVARAVQMLEDGSTQILVAQRLCVSRIVVERLWRRYQETDGYTRRQGQCRQRCTTARADRYLATCAIRSRFATAKQLQNYL